MRILMILGILAGMLWAVTIASVADSDASHPLKLSSAYGQEAEKKQAGEEEKKDEKPEKEEKKERLEKKKRDEQKTNASSSSSSSSDCFVDCLGGLFMSMLEDSDDDSDVEAPLYSVTEEYEEPLAGLMESQGVMGDVMAWNAPGGETAGSGIVFSVPAGGEVLVWRRAVAREDTAWLEISRLQMESSRGWVRARDVMVEETYEPALLVAGASPDSVEISEDLEPVIMEQPIAWLRGDVSWYTFLGDPLWGEYDGRGYQLRAMVHLLTAWGLQFGTGVGYARGHGKPTVVYDTPSLFDEPLDSDLHILSLELQFGQRYVWEGGRKSFAWGIGPTLFKVKESATIAYQEFDDGQPARAGIRTDTMTGWTLGFEGRISALYSKSGKYPIGVVTGFSFIPWDSKYEQSLTLDWLDRSYFVTYQLGLSWGALFF